MGRTGTPLNRKPASGGPEKAGSEREAALLSWIEGFAPHGVATLDASFQIQSWNRWMEAHSGLRFSEIAGKSLFTVFPDLKDRKLVPHFERALQGESSMLSTALHR